MLSILTPHLPNRSAVAAGQPLQHRFGRPASRGSAGGSRRILAGTAVAVLLTVSACGGDPADTSTSSTVPAAPGAVSTAADPLALAVAAYQGMWEAYQEAGLTADAGHPDLPRFATGDALEVLRAGLAAYREQGQVLKGDLITRPQVDGASPEASPTQVTIRDCLNTRNFLVYWRDGRLVDDEPGGDRDTRATVTVVEQVWKVASFGVQKVADVC
jgi:hypothetical protein